MRRLAYSGTRSERTDGRPLQDRPAADDDPPDEVLAEAVRELAVVARPRRSRGRPACRARGCRAAIRRRPAANARVDRGGGERLGGRELEQHARERDRERHRRDRATCPACSRSRARSRRPHRSSPGSGAPSRPGRRTGCPGSAPPTVSDAASAAMPAARDVAEMVGRQRPDLGRERAHLRRSTSWSAWMRTPRPAPGAVADDPANVVGGVGRGVEEDVEARREALARRRSGSSDRRCRRRMSSTAGRRVSSGGKWAGSAVGTTRIGERARLPRAHAGDAAPRRSRGRSRVFTSAVVMPHAAIRASRTRISDASSSSRRRARRADRVHRAATGLDEVGERAALGESRLQLRRARAGEDEMRVRVDEARQDDAALGIDDLVGAVPRARRVRARGRPPRSRRRGGGPRRPRCTPGSARSRRRRFGRPAGCHRHDLARVPDQRRRPCARSGAASKEAHGEEAADLQARRHEHHGHAGQPRPGRPVLPARATSST